MPCALTQWGFGTKPSTAKFRVELGIRTLSPSNSLVVTIWQPRRELHVWEGGVEVAQVTASVPPSVAPFRSRHIVAWASWRVGKRTLQCAKPHSILLRRGSHELTFQ